jgi:transcriptional regulator with XRE-family HTH domain
MSAQPPEWALTPKQQLGQRLRALRGDMQSKDIATMVGVSADLTSRIELGERWPKPDVVKAWARATGHSDEAVLLVESLEELKLLESRLRAEAQKPRLAQDLRSDLFRRAGRVRTRCGAPTARGSGISGCGREILRDPSRGVGVTLRSL